MNGPNLRTGAMPQPANMLGMSSSPFMQNPMSQPQPPLGPNPMVIPQNPSIPNQSMGMPPQSATNSMVTSSAVQRFMSNNTINQQQRTGQSLPMRGANGQPGLLQSAPTLASAPMAGLGPNQLPMGFPSTMIQGQPTASHAGVRRVASQTSMNPSNIPGMPPNMAGNMPMGMNAMNSLPAHLRQVRQQQHQQPHQPPGSGIPQQPMGGIVNDMSMSLNRQAPNPGMQQNIGMNINKTAPSPQVMSSLQSQPQPSSHNGPHLAGMPHHSNFQSPVQMPAQHQHPQMTSPSPRPVTHTPNMPIGASGPSHTPVNVSHPRGRMTPDNNNGSNMFMSYPPGHQFQGNAPRITPGPAPFPVAPGTSPTPSIDIGGVRDTQTQSSFPLTPAQQLIQMQAPSDGSFPNQFGNMPPPNAPPRPPSQHNHNSKGPQMQQPPQQSPAHHSSPMATDHMTPQPQRPRSQQSISGRPPSAQNRTQTPRAPPQQLPGPPPAGLSAGGLTSIGRISSQHPQPQVQPSAQGAHPPIAPRPPQVTGPSSVNTASSSQAPSDTPPSNASVIPRPQLPSSSAPGLGQGQGLIRLLQFSGVLSGETNAKLQLSWWNDLIQKYFTSRAVMKFTLWKDNQRNEAKPFEIGVPILPRFFLVTTQSGVKSMTLSLDGARERFYNAGHAVVECVTAVWTYKYTNGYTVTLRGPLTCHVVVSPPSSANAPLDLKFEDFQFDANCHDKYIALESIHGTRVVESPKTPRTRNASTPTPSGSTAEQQREEDKRWEEPRVILERGSIPGEPVNAFGIPQATMRCLELAESVGAMGELITYATEAALGPKDALREFAAKLREQQAQQIQNGTGPGLMNGGTNPAIHHPFAPFPSTNGGAPVTLYSSAPPSVTNPSLPNPLPHSSGHSPQNGPPSAVNSPQKQHKTIPQSQSASSSVTAASPAVSTSTAANTPSMANATLKRKQTSDTSSPTTGAADQPAPKRPTRGKKGRAGG